MNPTIAILLTGSACVSYWMGNALAVEMQMSVAILLVLLEIHHNTKPK